MFISKCLCYFMQILEEKVLKMAIEPYHHSSE